MIHEVKGDKFVFLYRMNLNLEIKQQVQQSARGFCERPAQKWFTLKIERVMGLSDRTNCRYFLKVKRYVAVSFDLDSNNLTF